MSPVATGAQTWTVKINGVDYTAPEDKMTGAQLKELGRVPAGEVLYLKEGNSAQERPISDDETVRIRPNMEFESAPDGGVS